MLALSFCRSIAGLTLGVMLTSTTLSYGHDDYSSDSYDTDPSYDRDSSTPPRNPYDPYKTTQLPSFPTASQYPSGTGVPFGLSKSAAGAIVGGILGAGSGAIIGSHKGKAGQGAAIGAGLGAVGGYLTGRQLEQRDQTLDSQRQGLEQQRQEIARNRALIEELKRRKLDVRETDRGVVVNLPDVLFEFNSDRLTVEARDKVNHIATVLNDQANGRHVSVEGHADAIGSEAYNLALSERRAEAVARELSYDGVRESQLTTRGYGEKYPVAPNTNSDGSDNPDGRAKNRRVEVVIEN